MRIVSASSWFIVSIIGFSLSAVLLAVSIFLFIRLKIPSVIGDLTGRTVAREIRAMRESNTMSGQKIHKSSRVNIDRGKLTQAVNDQSIEASPMAIVHSSKRLDNTPEYVSNGEAANSNQSYIRSNKIDHTTEYLSENVSEVELGENNNQNSGRITDILVDEPDTANVGNAQNTEILTSSGETELLGVNEPDSKYGTTVLDNKVVDDQINVVPVKLNVVKSYVVIHSDEIIK